MNKKCCVYIHINKFNNKKYIGITEQKPEDRWKKGTGYKPTSHFRNAIDKYGWDSFEHIILFDNLSREEAALKERELIAQYKTTNREYGYNNSDGGELGFHYTHSEESKKKMSEKAKAREVNTKAIEAMKARNSRAVVCIETQQVYESASEAARQLGIKNHISECCRGTRKTCAGYHWQYAQEGE